MTSRNKIYLDSCCFIELAKAKSAKTLESNGSYIWPLQTILKAGRDGALTVYTSMLSVAECVHDGDGQNISEDVQRLFRAMLTSGRGGVIPYQTDYFVMERARDLRWKHNITLKPADSIHVATAIEAECQEFITWDGVGAKRASPVKASSALSKFGLKVVTPDMTLLIPESYRQSSIQYFKASDGEEETRAQT